MLNTEHLEELKESKKRLDKEVKIKCMELEK